MHHQWRRQPAGCPSVCPLWFQCQAPAPRRGQHPLPRTEFDLLHALVDSGKQVRTKSDLVRRLRGEGYDVGSYISDADERTIEVHMANLRRKMGDNPRDPRWIKTVRGVGYRLVH